VDIKIARNLIHAQNSVTDAAKRILNPIVMVDEATENAVRKKKNANSAKATVRPTINAEDHWFVEIETVEISIRTRNAGPTAALRKVRRHQIILTSFKIGK